jgi:hypothetical protein
LSQSPGLGAANSSVCGPGGNGRDAGDRAVSGYGPLKDGGRIRRRTQCGENSSVVSRLSSSFNGPPKRPYHRSSQTPS